MTRIVSVATILYFAICVDTARILAYFPTPSISHQIVFRPLTQELAKRGHEVVIVTADPAFTKGQTPKNLTEIDVHDLSYNMWSEHFLSRPAGTRKDFDDLFKTIFILMNKIIERQLQTDEVQNLINDKNNKFDLLIFEAFARQLMVFSHLFKAPVIQISSFGTSFTNYKTMGAPIHEILYPTNVRQKLYNLTLYEKIFELYRTFKLEWFYSNLEEDEYAMVKRVFGDDIPTLKELAYNVDMLFVNVHPIWEDVRPHPPSIIHINGIVKKEDEKIPDDLKQYLDSSKNGVIYISFGTNVKPSSLSPEKIQILTKVFSELPYDVIWKWDQDTLPGISKNIKLSKWLPQPALLKHPKIKLFITQGGLQSTDEAIDAAVPLIGVPMLGDQWYNVEKYVHHKIGKRIDFDTLTEDDFRSAINTVISDKSYRDNIQRLRSLMQDQPQSPLERAVWWTEYVLRHGGAKHLHTPAAKLTWAEYLELRLIFVLLTGLVIAFTVTVIAIYYLFKQCKKMLSIEKKIKSQ